MKNKDERQITLGDCRDDILYELGYAQYLEESFPDSPDTKLNLWQRLLNRHKFCVFVNACYDLIRWKFNHLICKVFGHKWIDESYGGPEGGGEFFCCDRCGKSFGNTLY